MTVSVITPTADRPVAVALAERWMARQTRPPDEWIVADGGLVPVACSQGQVHLHAAAPAGAQNFLANLLRGLDRARGDLIVWWEDDDWYAPTHLDTVCRQFTPGVQAAGDDLQQYYHVARRLFRTFHNRGASLCQTAFTREAAPIFRASVDRCRRLNTYGVDGGFWAAVPAHAQALRRTQTVIGIKGLPGQAGLGIGHRPAPTQWSADPDLVQLRAWIGDDADVYAALWRADERGAA